MKIRPLILPLLTMLFVGTLLCAEARSGNSALHSKTASGTPSDEACGDTTVFALLDLSRPGLERVARFHTAGDDQAAAQALLEYFRTRRGVVCPDVDLDSVVISADEQRWADEALEHRFFVHSGYQPSFFYGDDIDWQYWPVKDNELRWQLHRMKWWVPMGKAYRRSGDERYATEWCAEYND